jgi:hypothetical protein
MGGKKDEKTRREEDQRRNDRFAWLGPLMERRKAKAEPIKDPDEGQELEDMEE